MGDTLLTHILPYMANTLPSKCSSCHVTLSVHHILLHCMRYREERRPLVQCPGHSLSLTQTALYWLANTGMWWAN
ncbi:hypothetical protein E2C01_069185 [Portunus trituberculatus]|uniref:Uncharacterized protein n=1 Tax=Portunus trituberculatus TaxID=210409 RepID=A0A5B7HYQ3_PORTR|nr:hypothetical protein [Portunus trituberculatus]